MEPTNRLAVAGTVAMVVAVVALAAWLVLARQDDPGTSSSSVPAAPTGSTEPTDPEGPGTTPTRQPDGTPSGPTPSLPVPSVCVPDRTSRDLDVVTFNIHSARLGDGSVRLGEIGEELARWDPDVVLLQEVDRGRAWSDRLDMPAVLAERLGMSWTFGTNVRRSATNLYGTAILSRYAILDSENTLLPRPRDTQQRGLLRAGVEVDGVAMNFYVTHLEAGDPPARLLQMRRILTTLRDDPGPKIVGGDLNASPLSPVLAGARTVLDDVWTAVGDGSGLTAPARVPRVRIDYLLHAGSTQVEVEPLGAQVLASSISDHRAVRATYRITADEGEVCVPVLPEQDSGT